jgi:hypothetical protein
VDGLLIEHEPLLDPDWPDEATEAVSNRVEQFSIR